MGNYLLQLEATLFNCTNLQLQNGFDHPSHEYHFELVCKRCQEKVPARVSHATTFPFPPELLEDDSDSSFDFDDDKDEDEDAEDHEDKEEEEEEEELRRKETLKKIRESNPTVHFAHPCKCDNIMWVDMELGYGSPLEIAGEATDPQSSFTAIMAFYVSGAKPINYKMGAGWQVDMVGGNRRFEGVDLSEANVHIQDGEQQMECPVLIMNPKASFVPIKDLHVNDN